MQHNYFIAWPRIMKIDQIDVMFAVSRSKMKLWVTFTDSLNDIERIFVFFGERSKFISPSGHNR